MTPLLKMVRGVAALRLSTFQRARRNGAIGCARGSASLLDASKVPGESACAVAFCLKMNGGGFLEGRFPSRLAELNPRLGILSPLATTDETSDLVMPRCLPIPTFDLVRQDFHTVVEPCYRTLLAILLP